MDLLWLLFARSAWAHPATVLADSTGEGAALASFRLVGVGLASHCGGRHDRIGPCSSLCSLGRIGLEKALWWRARQVRELLCPLVARWAWAQPTTVVAVTTVEGAALDSVRFVSVGSAIHSVGGQDW
jgi:hypothetical protein